MAANGVPYVFVGSKEGSLRVYLMDQTDGSLTSAGSHKLSDISFFAVVPADGSEKRCTAFVSGRNRLTALTYDIERAEFTSCAAAMTSGGGTHLSVAEAQRAVLLAHYGENLLSCFSYKQGDWFGDEQVLAPGEKAHQVRAHQDRVYVPCLGSNHIAQYDWAGLGSDAQLVARTPVPCAGGPRHLAFHPRAPVVYVLTELSSQIHVYDVSAEGELTRRPTGSTFTHEDGEYHWSSDIQIRPDGAFVYAVNRKPSEMVLFKVLPDFNLARVASLPLVGEVRSFGMDPGGMFLQVGSRDGVLQNFKLDKLTGYPARGPSISGLGAIYHTEIISLRIS
jgi:6-phosphogluconolactonase (cycloisomerase 2 family)